MNDHQYHLSIKELHASVDGKKILNGLNLEVKSGETTVLMGPNGSGKSTLAHVIMGHPKYLVESGRIMFNGKNVLDLPVNERAKLGIFLSFQYPSEIHGVTVSNFLRTALNAVNAERLSVSQFRELLQEKMKLLHIDESFVNRSLNAGFSGGEKKKCEILQLAIMQPKLAILDETDSGLDIDALRIVSEGVNKIKNEHKQMGVLVITHYNRILEYIKPDTVHVMLNGKIVMSGGSELVEKLEEKGYEWVRKQTGEKVKMNVKLMKEIFYCFNESSKFLNFFLFNWINLASFPKGISVISLPIQSYG